MFRGDVHSESRSKKNNFHFTPHLFLIFSKYFEIKLLITYRNICRHLVFYFKDHILRLLFEIDEAIIFTWQINKNNHNLQATYKTLQRAHVQMNCCLLFYYSADYDVVLIAYNVLLSHESEVYVLRSRRTWYAFITFFY